MMASQDIIDPVGDEACEWNHPLVAFFKPSDSVSLTMNLSRLKQVLCILYPLPTPYDATCQVTSGACFFTTLDVTMGYWKYT